METKHRKDSRTKSNDNKILIPKDIMEKLNRLPNKNIIFEEWEDKVILEYSKTKTIRAISKLLNKNEATVSRRYTKLKQDI